MTLLNSRPPAGVEAQTEEARVVWRHLEALANHDLRRALSYLATDVDVETQLVGHLRRRRRFGAWLRAVLAAFPDLSIHVVELEANGRAVLTRWVVAGTFKAPYLGRRPTGERMVLRGLSLDTVEDGRIRRRRLLWDSANALVQLRVLPVEA